MRHLLAFAGAAGAAATLGAAELPPVDAARGLLDLPRALAAAAAATPAAHPDADMVVVDDYELVQYRPDGTSTTWNDYAVKVLTEKGKREEKTQTVWFNAAYGTAEVLRVEIHRPGGDVRPVDLATQTRVAVASDQMSDNIYDPNHKLVQVGVPGLETGDVLRCFVRREERRVRMPDAWADWTVFEGTSPILAARYEVWAPKARPLLHRALKAAVPGTVRYSAEELGEWTRHRWDIAGVPRMFEEPNMPESYTVVQRLLVSTIPDWQGVSRWYWNLSRPHLEAVTPGMREAVAGLTNGVTGRRQRIEAVFQFVSQKIRYMGITTETEAPGYEPHDVSVTFDHRYGVCRDKAALLVALLRLAGFEAFPVLIHNGPRKDAEVPQPYFNHAIVAVREADGSDLLMDPTDESTRELLPAYLGHRSYLVATPEGDPLRTSPVAPAGENLVRIRTAGRLLDGGGLRAETSLRFEGINDGAYRGHFARIKPDERERFFAGLLRRVVPGARLERVEILPADVQDTSRPLEVKLAYEAPDAAISGGGLTLAPAPWFGTSLGMVNFILGRTGLRVRKYPLETEFACGVEESFALDLDGTVGSAESLPASPPVALPTLEWSQSLAAPDGRLEGRTRFLIKTAEFSPGEYAQLKEALRAIEYERRKAPLFASRAPDAWTRPVPWSRPAAPAPAPGAARVGAAAPDVRVLAETHRIELENAHAWTTISEVRKQVLTYAGVKQNAELKLGYNPVWDDLAVETARVVRADGKVLAVSAAETNLMDAEWVGRAPRYPAAKTLVVSLPGVEVGATVEYRLRRRTRERPFFSQTIAFSSFEPVDAKRVVLAAPRGLAVRIDDATAAGVAARSLANEGDRRVWTWTATNLPVVAKEDDLPPSWVGRAAVLVSAGDWRAYAREAAARLEAAASDFPLPGETVFDPAAPPLERVRAIRDWAARRVRPAGPGFDQLPLSAVSDAGVTVRDGYGHSADRAAVIFALLRRAGLGPRFVLGSPWPAADGLVGAPSRTPQFGLFDEVLVAARVGDRTIRLNDTDQYARLGATPHEDRLSLPLPDGGVAPLRVAKEDASSTDVRCEVVVDAEGAARVVTERRYYGQAHGLFCRQFAEMPPEERRRYLQEELGEISQLAEADGPLVTETDRYPGVERYAARVPRFAVRDGGRLYLALPAHAANLLRLQADRRAGPLYWSAARRQRREYLVRGPDGFGEATLVPEEVRWARPGIGSVRLASSVEHTPSGTVVRVTRDLDLCAGLVKPEDYPSLVEANNALSHRRSATVLFTRTGDAKPEPRAPPP